MKCLSIAGPVLALSALIAAAPLSVLAEEAPAVQTADVAVFEASASDPHPSVKSVIGEVREHTCRRAWDTPATASEILQPLKDKARSLGANGLIDVRFDHQRVDQKVTCWQRDTVTGTAVVLASPTP